MSYRIEITRSAAKALKHVTTRDRERMQDRIDALADDPRPQGCQKISGEVDL